VPVLSVDEIEQGENENPLREVVVDELDLEKRFALGESQMLELVSLNLMPAISTNHRSIEVTSVFTTML
jgi:hypothetical protein